MSTFFLRYNQSSALKSMLAKVTTTAKLKVTTTTVSGSDVSTSGYGSAIFITRVVANASSLPYVTLDAKIDTTTYAAYTTLHTDLTTTANNKYTYIATLPNTVRVSVRRKTTTTSARLSVKAIFKVV